MSIAGVVEAGEVEIAPHRDAAVDERLDAGVAEAGDVRPDTAVAGVVVVARDGPYAEGRAQPRELGERLGVGFGPGRLIDQVATQQHEVGRFAQRGVHPRADRRGADELAVVEVGEPGDADRRT